MEVVSIGESMVALVNEPTGFIRHTNKFKPFLAGAETNTLIGLSRLGHNTSWMSAVGDDELGEFILHKIRAENVDTSLVKRDKNQNGIIFKQILPGGDVDVTYYRKNSAASNMTIDDIDIEVINNAKILYLTGITLSISDKARDMLFNVVKKINSEVKVVFDPNIRLKMWSREEARKIIFEFLPYVDYLIIGQKEVEILLEHEKTDEAFIELERLGCPNIIIKSGKSGAAYKLDGNRGNIENPKTFIEADPVGAGDAFAAGIISGLLKENTPLKMIKKACFLGGYVTQFQGDYQGFPTEKILDTALNDPNSEKVNR